MSFLKMMENRVLSYNSHEFAIPQLTKSGGKKLKPRPERRMTGSTVRKVGSCWDLSNFSSRHVPLQASGPIEGEVFSTNRGIRILDMLIKMKGSVDDYRIPRELLPFESVIQRVIDLEHATFHPDEIKGYHAYLTVDQQRIKEGMVQRNSGAHVDGFQGERIFPKNQINHSYVVSNLVPTRYFTHSFNLQHIDTIFHNIFKEFDRQAKTGSVSCQLLTKERCIYFMNAYCVHEAIPTDQAGYRTFVRVSYDPLKFDRLGNTLNPMFDCNWEMIPRRVQDTLVEYETIPEKYQDLLYQFFSSNHSTGVKEIRQALWESKGEKGDLYYNFLHYISHIENKDLRKIVFKEIDDCIEQDIKLARLCSSLITRTEGEEKRSLMKILQKAYTTPNSDWDDYSTLLLETLNRDSSAVDNSVARNFISNLTGPDVEAVKRIIDS